jgi:hypothetical protein
MNSGETGADSATHVAAKFIRDPAELSEKGTKRLPFHILHYEIRDVPALMSDHGCIVGADNVRMINPLSYSCFELEAAMQGSVVGEMRVDELDGDAFSAGKRSRALDDRTENGCHAA